MPFRAEQSFLQPRGSPLPCPCLAAAVPPLVPRRLVASQREAPKRLTGQGLQAGQAEAVGEHQQLHGVQVWAGHKELRVQELQHSPKAGAVGAWQGDLGMAEWALRKGSAYPSPPGAAPGNSGGVRLEAQNCSLHGLQYVRGREAVLKRKLAGWGGGWPWGRMESPDPFSRDPTQCLGGGMVRLAVRPRNQVRYQGPSCSSAGHWAWPSRVSCQAENQAKKPHRQASSGQPSSIIPKKEGGEGPVVSCHLGAPLFLHDGGL